MFRVQGELCHLIGSLHSDKHNPPSFTQLYIYDVRLAFTQRMNRNENLFSRTMQLLQSMLLDFHLYANEFKHAFQLLKQYPDEADADICL